MASTSITQGPTPVLASVITLPAADVATDASGDITVTFPDLQEVLFGSLHVAGGYLTDCLSVSGNTATFRIYQNKDPGDTGGADIPFPVVASGTTLGTARAIGFGL